MMRPCFRTDFILCCFSGLRIRNHLRVSTLAAAAIGIETGTETEIAITIQTSENEREAPRPANTNRRRNPDVKTSKENVKTSKENDETSKKMIEKYLNFERLELLSLHFSGLLTTKVFLNFVICAKQNSRSYLQKNCDVFWGLLRQFIEVVSKLIKIFLFYNRQLVKTIFVIRLIFFAKHFPFFI
jgi:hypothetical protein